jgi:hypothetical protein
MTEDKKCMIETVAISPELHIGPWIIDDHGWRYSGSGKDE